MFRFLLFSIQQICRKARLIIDNTPSFQYMIELSAAGYDVSFGDLRNGIVDRLNKFRNIQRAYRYPSPKLLRTIDLEVSSSLHGKLSEVSWSWEAAGPVLVGQASMGIRNCLVLLSLLLETPMEERFRVLSFDLPIDHCWTPSRTQNVMVVRQGHILHLISTVPQSHEGALCPSTIHLEPRSAEVSYTIHGFSEDWLLVACKSPNESLIRAYDWRSGHVKKVGFYVFYSK